MEIDQLVLRWRFRIHRVQLAHYDAARKFERLHLWLGLPAIVLSTIVGTTVFATLQQFSSRDPSSWMVGVQISLGLLSVAAAVFTSLQTFLGYSALAEKHRVAGARSANLKHQIELVLVADRAGAEDTSARLTEIEKRWAEFREESPTIPEKIWRRVEQELTPEEHAKRYPPAV